MPTQPKEPQNPSIEFRLMAIALSEAYKALDRKVKSEPEITDL